MTLTKHIVEARFALYRETGQSVTDNPVDSCKQLRARYQSQIDAEESVIHALDQELLACKDEQEAAESVYSETLSMIKHAELDWIAYLENSPWWLDLLCLVPVIGKEIRKRRMARDRRFLMSNPLTADRKHRDDGMELCFDDLKKTALASKTSTLEPIIDRLTTIASQKKASIQRRIVFEQELSKINTVFMHWQDTLNHGYESLLDVSLEKLNDRLDTALRAPMFSMSDWYWSGKWLLEMKDRMTTGETDSKGRVRLEAKYRRFAKISPCIVSNLHMAPSFFTAWQGENKPFWNAIDLLIVDEAGQVAPDVGAAMFALAKRALVVGDVYQIEPVWNNGEKTDRANAAKFGLISNPHDLHYDTLAGGGYTPAKGSLMRIANRSCQVQKYDDMRGLMLTEHRRCVPELISYCNKLIYSGRLDPMRPSIERSNRILPAFGYLNIVGQDKKTNGESRHNCKEAEAIVRWIKANRMQIVNHYTDQYGEEIPLWKLLAIITPFKSQARMIDRLLRTEMPDLTRKNQSLTVGTVHALQGAERAIVIFSPTYGESFKGGAFFDQTPNMLNVAVSRAKDSFLVIGNMAVFDTQKRSRPSGLLAAYLANKGENLVLE